MQVRHWWIVTVAAGMIVTRAQGVLADPCGMVPPVYLGEGPAITRVGAQKTYVFYKDGVETFAIRPGFSGKVDDFGMLIPFPTPPALRKLPDHAFHHIAAAIDPPEVVVDLRRMFYARNAAARPGPPMQAKAEGLKYDEVRVLRQEAVGMYEVAVLEAGSSKALRRWMDDHGYKYPTGMDAACDEYVEARWCFVAVKTKVGQKQGIQPRPRQRSVDSKLPAGSTFDGRVQAMGFRFKWDELVVPMRLSAFNVGEFRNIVYLVTDGPRKIRNIPEEYVVRQVPGEQVYRSLTEPLPLRIIGGDVDDLPDWWKKNLPQQRNPTPKNGAAKDLFAADLWAVSSGELSLPHEEKEKELLRIGERLGLRGAEIDAVNAQVLADEREQTVQAALKDLKGLTLTVVDGDFPPEILGRENLTFAEYKMPSGRNRPEIYDAKVMGPGPKKEGTLILGALPAASRGIAAGKTTKGQSPAAAIRPGKSRLAWPISLLATAVVGLAVAGRLKGRSARAARLVLLIGVLLVAMGSVVFAQQPPPAAERPTIRQLINQLSHPDKAQAAVDALVARGKEAIPLLSGEAIEGNDVARRGWAIVCLAEIGGEEVDQLLTKVHNDPKQPMVVRTWAAAARVYMTDTAEGLLQMANLIPSFPALGRPVGMRMLARLGAGDEPVSPEDVLTISIRVPQLQQALAPVILALGPKKLTAVMATAKDQNVRRQAAAYLGTLAGQGDKDVPAAVIAVYKFDADANDVPWKGGPLFVPGINWGKDDARALVANMISWHLWCDRHGRAAEQKQIHNNIRSLSLARAAGYQSPGWQDVGTVKWLTMWGKAVGRKEIERILKEQGVDTDRKYSGVLENL